MADAPLSFDDLPSETPPQQAAPAQPTGGMSFDDLPSEAPPQQKAPARPAAVSFDDLPSETPPQTSPQISGGLPVEPQPSAEVKQMQPAALSYLISHPPRSFSLEASAIPNAQLAKAGTEGYAQDISDKQREAEGLKNSAVGFFNARIQELFTDPEFVRLSPAAQDQIISHQVSQWEQAGLPAGKFNPASPSAWLGDTHGRHGLRDAVEQYVNDIRDPTKGGVAGAQPMGAIFDPKGKLAVQQTPGLIESAGMGLAAALPSTSGATLGGELGGLAGGAVAPEFGGEFFGGVAGALGGGYLGEKGVRDFIRDHGTDAQRSGFEAFDELHGLGEETHPVASWLGAMAAQGLTQGTGLGKLLFAPEGTTVGQRLATAGSQFAPRLSGAALGAGIETGSELAQDQPLDPYHIGEMAASGAFFNKPRFMPDELAPLSFTGRKWQDTNGPRPEMMNEVDSFLRAGNSPADVFSTYGNDLPDTPENRRAVRVVSADIRHGRDPSQSLGFIQFRPNGISVDQAVSVVNDKVKNWKDAPNITVHDNYDSESIPDDIKGKVGPGTLGWKDDQGDIHIIASQHADPAAVTATLFHEAAHAGAFRQGLQDKFVNIYDNANPNLKSALVAEEEVQAKNNPEWGKLSEDQRKSLVTDEVLSSSAENGLHNNEFAKVGAWIRAFGRGRLGAFGKSLSYSDSEIRQIMQTSFDAVSKGAKTGADLGTYRYLNYGQQSQTADQASLLSYVKTGGAPLHPEYPQGWFRSPVDQMPRYEVSDRNATLDTSKLDEIHPQRLEDVLHHPELYAAYPEMKDVKVKWDNTPGTAGTWSHRDKTIYLNPEAEDKRSTMLHEVQHAIQDREGWAGGANDSSVYRTAPTEAIHNALDYGIQKNADRANQAAKEYHELQDWAQDPMVQHVRDVFNAYQNREVSSKDYSEAESQLRQSKGVSDPWDPDYNDRVYKTIQSDRPVDWHIENARQDWERAYNKVQDLTQAHGDEYAARAAVRHSPELSDYLYNRAGGEYESRAVQARQDMTDQQRLESPQFTRADARGVKPEDLYTPKDVGDIRFSRKYSGEFENTYEGRQEKTEDYIRNRFSPALADELKGKIKPLGEYHPVSDEQVAHDVAALKEAGFDPVVAMARGAIPDDTVFIHALKDIVYEHLSEARDLSRQYLDTNDERVGRQFLAKAMRTGELFSIFDKTASNLARMFRALGVRLDEAPDAGLLRLLDSIRFANGQMGEAGLKELAADFATKNDPTELRKSLDKFDPKWKQYATSLFYNFLLGSKSVQLAKVIGHATQIGRQFSTDALGYGLGKVLRTDERAHFDELVNKYSGLFGAMLNQKTWDGGRAWNNAAKQFVAPAGTSVIGNPLAHQAFDNRLLSIPLEYGTRGLQATDAFFRTALEHAGMQQLATVEARKLNKGEKPSTEQIAAVMASPSREMLAKVRDEATKMLFLEQPFDTARNLTRFLRGIPGGFLISPIIRTPANIGRAAVETFVSPLATQRGREAWAEGGAARNRVIAGQLMAGALWLGTYYLIKNGLVNGSGPQDPKTRAEWLLSHKPDTIANKYSLKDIAPIGTGLATIADLNMAYQNGVRKKNQDAGDTALQVAGGLSQALLQNSYLGNTADFAKDPKQAGIDLIGTLVQASANVPVYSQFEKETDPWKRDLSRGEGMLPNLLHQAQSRDNPLAQHYLGVGTRSELPIAKNIFGEPISADDPTSKDPVAIEVGRLAGTTGKAPVPTFSRTSKGMKVPNDLYDSFLSIAGPAVRDRVSRIMQSPEYKKALTDDQRMNLIAHNPTLRGLHASLDQQLQQMMLDRNPKFEGQYIPEWKAILSTIPGVK